MNDWKSKLKADQTAWLLEDDNPSVRYFTLVDLLEKAENDLEVIKTKEEIMQKGVVPVQAEHLSFPTSLSFSRRCREICPYFSGRFCKEYLPNR